MANTVVRTNTLSLNAHRNLGLVANQQTRASGRLSSGFRINTAADDAAGLGISEKMRAQIRGLDRAALNAQDGISLIQTAEGALDTVNEMLIRLRELLVQAANDTNVHEHGNPSQSDRVRIQDEIDQLLMEINAVAHRTEFNTRTLLDGSLSLDGVIRGGDWHSIDEVRINAPARITTLDQFLRMTDREPFIGSFEQLLHTIGANLEGKSASEWIAVHAGANFEGLEQALDAAMGVEFDATGNAVLGTGRWRQTQLVSGLRFDNANDLLNSFVQGLHSPNVLRTGVMAGSAQQSFDSWADFVSNANPQLGAATFARAVSQSGGEELWQALLRSDNFRAQTGLSANATFSDVRNVFYRMHGLGGPVGGWALGSLGSFVSDALSEISSGRTTSWLERRLGIETELMQSSASTPPLIVVPPANPNVTTGVSDWTTDPPTIGKPGTPGVGGTIPPTTIRPSPPPSSQFPQTSTLRDLTHFPREGSFVIQVRDPYIGTVNAIIDFGVVNPTGGFTLANFEDFFRNAFYESGVIEYPGDFSIDADGHINVQTLNGGPNSGVAIGLITNAFQISGHTNITLAPDLSTIVNDADLSNINFSKSVNSAFFGAQRAGTPVTSVNGTNTNVRVTQEELEQIRNEWASGDFFTLPNGDEIDPWQILLNDFNTNATGQFPSFQATRFVPATPGVPAHTVNHGPALVLSPTTLGYPQTFDEFLVAAQDAFANHPYLNKTSFPVTFNIDSGGFLRVDFGGIASVNPPATGSSRGPTFTPSGGGGSSVTSNHPAVASEASGELRIQLNVRGGDSPTFPPSPPQPGNRQVYMEIDFSVTNFSGWETAHITHGWHEPFPSREDYMVWWINQELNRPENWPNPLTDFYIQHPNRGDRPPLDTIPIFPVTYFPVARASLNSAGQLVINAAENMAGTGLSVIERGSDRPMFQAPFGTPPARAPAVELAISGEATRTARDSAEVNLSSVTTGVFNNIQQQGTFRWVKVPAGADTSHIDADWLSINGTASTAIGINYAISHSGISTGEYTMFIIKEGTLNVSPFTPFTSYMMTLQIPPFHEEDLWEIFTNRYLTADSEIVQREIWLANPQERDRGMPLWFQIGANSGQGITVGINGMTTRDLGYPHDLVHLIDVEDPSGIPISDQLGYIDNALTHVNRERSFLGAVQNRLEFARENVNIASENLSNANSRIRDADMALEMMNLTQSNVLQQAAISILAQANQAPQSVLQLLQ